MSCVQAQFQIVIHFVASINADMCASDFGNLCPEFFLHRAYAEKMRFLFYLLSCFRVFGCVCFSQWDLRLCLRILVLCTAA